MVIRLLRNMTHLTAILALGLLCAGWIGLQFLARRAGTKNHFDHARGSCSNCTCGGNACER